MNNLSRLLSKVEQAKVNQLDLSSDEDLSIAVMNLISIEEHLFFTSQKTDKQTYLDLLNEVRLMRTQLLKKLIGDVEGEVWCISKHLLASSMRVMEVGTKQLKKGNKKSANDLFEKSFKLYSLFWGINLKIIPMPEVKHKDQDSSVFNKLTSIVKKAVDCCKE